MVSAEALTVLIIDDNPDDCESLERAISKITSNTQYRVLIAHDADQALKIYSENDVDCALVDYLIPQTNGVEIIRKLHHPSVRKQGKKLPVALISGAWTQQNKIFMDNMTCISKDDLYSSKDVEKQITKLVSSARG